LSLLPIVSRFTQPQAVGLPSRQIHKQGDVNCCVSCALSTALEAADPAMPPLAPLYHFFFAGGPETIASGLTINQAQGALLRRGMCALDRHPYGIARSNVDQQPDEAAVEDGLGRRPIDPSSGTLLWKPVSILTPQGVTRQLAAGFPVVLAFQPNEDYLDLKEGRPTLADNGPPYDVVGHAATIIGYSDPDAVFIVQDSRGLSFGITGQWFLPYDLLSSPFAVMAFVLAPNDM
jgi:hypothetical protein